MCLRRLWITEEDFNTEIPALKITFDRLPNPTTETRVVFQQPCRARRLTARNIFGKILLNRMWNNDDFGCPASFNGTILEIYPVKEVMPSAG